MSSLAPTMTTSPPIDREDRLQRLYSQPKRLRHWAQGKELVLLGATSYKRRTPPMKLFFTLFLALPASVLARIGDTEADLIQRYGQPVSQVEAIDGFPGV